MKNFIFDTSIWLDFFEKREKNGEVAFILIIKIIENNWEIFYSDLHIKELKNLGYTQDDIFKMFSIVNPNNLRKVHIYRKQIAEASRIAKERNVPKRDALQAVLSRNNYLQLISRDRHFEQLRDITIAKIPEDFI